ncbi:hypothetical protein SEA_SATIS_114 [Streptomyces phage Satis]|nr:hypothetical protein SEA_SATIS_114 [Streptomyces phage Satis]
MPSSYSSVTSLPDRSEEKLLVGNENSPGRRPNPGREVTEE